MIPIGCEKRAKTKSQKQKLARAKIEENKINRYGGTRFLWNVYIYVILHGIIFVFDCSATRP